MLATPYMKHHFGSTKQADNKKSSTAPLITSVPIICIIGLTLLYSAAGGSLYPWAARQFYILLCFVPIALLARIINLTWIYKSSYYVYFFCLFLLLLAEILGHYAMGAQRWVRFGTFNIQPSEFMKIAVIIVLAHYFHSLHHTETLKLKFLLIPFVLVLLPVFLILKQPNLGTAIITIIVSSAIFFTAGAPKRLFIIPSALLLALSPLIWKFLHNYQKKRILTFMAPENDLLGAGYNIMQSQIAIGSGGLYGKGLLNGSQSQLSFLPEKHTDFIFTLLAEEFGFIGCTVVMGLYAIIIFQCYRISLEVQHQFGRLVIIGFSTLIFVHTFVNIGMISGLLPIVGTPLPMLSYGGSNLGATLIGLGLVLNIHKHSHTPLNRGG